MPIASLLVDEPATMPAPVLAPALPADPPPEPAGRDRRAHERLTAEELEWLKTAKLRFGPAVRIIDLSAGGALIETTMPLRPGSTAALTFVARGGQVETATLTVVRCEVASLQRGLVYRGACVFDRTLALREFEESRKARRRAQARSASGHIDAFVDRVRAGMTTAPDARVEAGVSRLLAGLHANADVGHAPGAAAASTPEPAPNGSLVPAPPQLPDGWSRLVVRFLDGKLLKGFSQDFNPTRPHFHLFQSLTAGTDTRVRVPMPQLKAIFFVRDFEGNARYVETEEPRGHVPGRRVEVTFRDGEILRGATLGYKNDGSGFFVTPADRGGNNERVFVLPGAVHQVRFVS